MDDRPLFQTTDQRSKRERLKDKKKAILQARLAKIKQRKLKAKGGVAEEEPLEEENEGSNPPQRPILFSFFVSFGNKLACVVLVTLKTRTWRHSRLRRMIHQRSAEWRKWKWKFKKEGTPNLESLMSESGTGAKVCWCITVTRLNALKVYHE